MGNLLRKRAGAALALSLIATGCAERPVPIASTVPPLTAPAAVILARPTPPAGSAPGLLIPQRLADGGYATPNRNLSSDAQIWHMRVALNVAALSCVDPSVRVSDAYNGLLRTRKARLAESYKALSRQYASLDAFDTSMTRLYNYFAQPPAQPGFCAASSAVLAELVSVPDSQLAAFSAQAIARLDQPFVDFYTAYDRYRDELARWNGLQASLLH